MIVIYDLDKTSIYCPIADFLDRFIPKNKFLKKIYYGLYYFAHSLEIMLKLVKVNPNMYQRAKSYRSLPAVIQIVLTARHKTKMVAKHVDMIFKDCQPDIICCVAQSITDLSKARYLTEKLHVDPKNTQVVMFDDNYKEMLTMKQAFSKSNFIGFNVYFDGKSERISRC